MDTFLTLVILIFLAVILVGVAQKMHISYPIALVVGGTAIGFIPGLKMISFDPNLILVIVLPPILYYASFSISFAEFKRNWREIFSLALGLVLLTTVAIGYIFHWLFPQLPLALAFAFGAIVSPPDAISMTTIMKRFSISPRLLAIVEGESLVNDASALVLYKLAIIALLSGTFSLGDASLEFLKTVSGGILVGFVLGFLMQHFSRKYLNPVVAVLFSFTIPYITYISADYLGFSGVLAVVVNGLIGARIIAKHHSSLRRVLGYSFWDIFNLLMNCFVFTIIGLQLRHFIDEMTPYQLLLYAGYALFFTLVLIVIRFIWVYSRSGLAYLKALRSPKKESLCPQILREATLVGWSAMRGIVSLTAALALPYLYPNGKPIEGRDVVIFITFVVILLTLLLPSTTLSFLIRLMKLDHHEDHHQAHQARKRLVDIAVEKIGHLRDSKKITDTEYNFLASYFNLQRYVYEISTSTLKKMSNLESARLKVLQAQRNQLLTMWEQQEINDKLFRQLEHELDIEESHMARAELN